MRPVVLGIQKLICAPALPRQGKEACGVGPTNLWHKTSLNVVVMNPWVESLGMVLLAAGGMLIGAWFSRRPKPYWMFGYFIPLSLIFLYGAGSRYPTLTFVPPISWMMMGRNKFAIIGFIGSMVLATPLSR